VPLHGQKVVARENLGIPTNKEKASSRALNKALRHTAARVRHKLTARDVAKLLEHEELAQNFPAWQVRDYVLLAAGNISREELANKLGTGDVGLSVWLAGFEQEIIRNAFFLRLIKSEPTTGKPPLPDEFNRTKAEDDALVDRAAGRGVSGDGDSVIADFGDDDGDRKTIRTKHPKPLESFDKGHSWGQRTPDSSNDFDQTGSEVLHDDYDEESGA